MAIKNLNITSFQLQQMQSANSVEEMNSIVNEIDDMSLITEWKTVKRNWEDNSKDFLKEALKEKESLFEDFLYTPRVKAHIALYESALRVLEAS